MKNNRWKIIRVGLVLAGLLAAALLAWSGYKLHWRGSLDIRPAETPWPAAETVLNFRTLKMKVPAPFEPVSVLAEVSGPGDDDYLHYEEHLFADPDQARQALDRELDHRRDYLPSLGHARVSFYPVLVQDRPAVLAVEYMYGSPINSRFLLVPYLYVPGERSFLKIYHNNYVFLEAADDDRLDQAALGERERYLALTGELLRRLGPGDLLGPEGGLEALGRLSRDPASPFRVYLTSVRFRRPGREPEALRGPPLSPGLEIRQAAHWQRLPERDRRAELFRPALLERGPREKSSPLILGGLAGRETLALYPAAGPSLLFVWQQEPPPPYARNWQIYLYLGEDDPGQAPQWLGRWRQILDVVEFPDD